RTATVSHVRSPTSMPDAIGTPVESLEEFVLPAVPAATDAQILADLLHSYKIAEAAAMVEYHALPVWRPG
ncbi:MAG TPA: hypothetical protein V6C65_14465, partial [Allocoleopsis sp.]